MATGNKFHKRRTCKLYRYKSREGNQAYSPGDVRQQHHPLSHSAVKSYIAPRIYGYPFNRGSSVITIVGFHMP